MRIGDLLQQAQMYENTHSSFWMLVMDQFNGKIRLPRNIVLDTMDDLIRATYPNFQLNGNNLENLCERAILAGTNARVNFMNDLLLEELQGETVEYDICDTLIDKENDEQYLFQPEFLHSLDGTGCPPHKLRLKLVAL
jgi:hypothetical protein